MLANMVGMSSSPIVKKKKSYLEDRRVLTFNNVVKIAMYFIKVEKCICKKNLSSSKK